MQIVYIQEIIQSSCIPSVDKMLLPLTVQISPRFIYNSPIQLGYALIGFRLCSKRLCYRTNWDPHVKRKAPTLVESRNKHAQSVCWCSSKSSRSITKQLCLALVHTCRKLNLHGNSFPICTAVPSLCID